jgi:hypothetical protein
MSLIETIDLRYVKEGAHFATADRPGFGDLHSGLARYLMRSGGKAARSGGEQGARFAALGALEHVAGLPLGHRIPRRPYAEIVMPVVILAKRSINDLSAGRLIER